MTTLKQKQDIIDWLNRNGVTTEDSVVKVETQGDSLYITIVSDLDHVSSFYYTNRKLTMVSGNNVHIVDIKRMEKLPL